MHTSHFSHFSHCTLQTLHISHQTFHNAHCFSTFSQHSVQVLTIGVWIGNYRFLCCAATIWKHTQWRKVSTINDSPSAFFRFPAWFWCWCWWSPQYGRVHQISSLQFPSQLDLITESVRKNYFSPFWQTLFLKTFTKDLCVLLWLVETGGYWNQLGDKIAEPSRVIVPLSVVNSD